MKRRNFEIPLRMYTSEVLDLARWKSTSTLRKRQRAGLFPMPIDRGTEMIFNGEEVYRALGLIEDEPVKADENPFMIGLSKL